MAESLKDLYNWSKDLKSTDTLPALFIGHGSPMNGILDNEFSRQWAKMANEIPRPKAVLVVSAHWLTRGTFITAMENPKTIHDFGGFPKELFEVEYPAPGSPALAKETSDLVVSTNIEPDHEWGLDHGTWTVVRHMYPEADIPILQLSIDYYQSLDFHYRLGKDLQELRRRGVLVIGSGNMVHNLRMIAWDRLNEPEFGFDWALEMNSLFKSKIEAKQHLDLIDYRSLGQAGKLAIPTPDHYFPLLYLLGIQGKKEEVSFFNDKAVGGSLTMTSVRFG
jgi:4,5-DOPA dioxygenase extradiol